MLPRKLVNHTCRLVGGPDNDFEILLLLRTHRASKLIGDDGRILLDHCQSVSEVMAEMIGRTVHRTGRYGKVTVDLVYLQSQLLYLVKARLGPEKLL